MLCSFRELFSTLGLVSLVVPLLLVASASVGPVVVAGQTAPNAYYGDAETDSGNAIPQGTVIVAVAGQNPREVKDQITVDPAGTYGGSGGLDEKLRVSSEYDKVTFHIDDESGKQAAETDNPTAETERLDLTFPDSALPGVTPTPTPTATSTETESGTSTETESGTSTGTESGTSTETESGTSTGTESGTSTETESGPVTETPTETPSGPDTTTTTDADRSTESTTANPTPAGGESTATNTTSATETPTQDDGGFLPGGILRIAAYIIVPIVGIYGVLKALAIYYGY